MSETTLDELVVILGNLQETVTSRLISIETELVEVEPQLLDLQEALQKAQAEYNRLKLNRDVAQETYLSLARKVDEERITSGDMTRGIRLASSAAVPEEPVRSRTIINTIIAIIVGTIVGIFIVLAITWWQKDLVQVDNSMKEQ